MPGDTTQPTPGMPDAYRRWRSSRPGHITDTLKERLIVGLAGPPSGRRILDAGRGDAVLAMALAKRGAIVTCVDADQRMLAARRAAGGSLICEFGRWSLWAAKRRASGWLGSHTRRRATFRSAHAPKGLVTEAGLTVTGMHGAIYNPPFGAMAALLAGSDVWIAKRTTAGAAFLVVQGRKSA